MCIYPQCRVVTFGENGGLCLGREIIANTAHVLTLRKCHKPTIAAASLRRMFALALHMLIMHAKTNFNCVASSDDNGNAIDSSMILIPRISTYTFILRWKMKRKSFC